MEGKGERKSDVSQFEGSFKIQNRNKQVTESRKRKSSWMLVRREQCIRQSESLRQITNKLTWVTGEQSVWAKGKGVIFSSIDTLIQSKHVVHAGKSKRRWRRKEKAASLNHWIKRERERERERVKIQVETSESPFVRLTQPWSSSLKLIL